ncbi:uncharacterized protein BO80DRAFT_124885 [Aspergillus ibericus CBS 121593]|uniref:Uncharacterized protein n=1 Tax=Aspergillus ibericus CBS 121593 TaxID=1448316 RepID=A0A395GV90_9EURO|nr:hypothetical protein BO80DRAFT_124885 [Aspergillus ibericus CBS 121593]RAK99480.1 hypothetical protein BO80DRAFT_124885 [Aspergillus ibericus CBS 121593]
MDRRKNRRSQSPTDAKAIMGPCKKKKKKEKKKKRNAKEGGATGLRCQIFMKPTIAAIVTRSGGWLIGRRVRSRRLEGRKEFLLRYPAYIHSSIDCPVQGSSVPEKSSDFHVNSPLSRPPEPRPFPHPSRAVIDGGCRRLTTPIAFFRSFQAFVGLTFVLCRVVSVSRARDTLCSSTQFQP